MNLLPLVLAVGIGGRLEADVLRSLELAATGNPAAAKKAVIGNGSASKEQVARMLEHLLGTGRLDVPADATDALALAFAGVKRREAAGLVPGRPAGARTRAP